MHYWGKQGVVRQMINVMMRCTCHICPVSPDPYLPPSISLCHQSLMYLSALHWPCDSRILVQHKESRPLGCDMVHAESVGAQPSEDMRLRHSGQVMGFNLEFEDGLWERDFMVTMGRFWCRQDVILAGLAALGSSVELFKNANHSMVPSLVLCIHFCTHVILFCMAVKDREEYIRWRWNGLFWLKPWLALVHGISLCYRDVSIAWSSSSLMGLVIQSSFRFVAAPLVVNTLGLQLPFRRQVFVLLLCSTSFLGCVRSLCTACTVDKGVMESVHTLGWRTESFLTRISVLGFPVDIATPELGEYPCWLVGLFYGTVFEVLVPAFVTYVSECNHRTAFLQSRSDGKESAEYNELKKGRITLGVAYLIVTIQLVWFTLRAFCKL